MEKTRSCPLCGSSECTDRSDEYHYHFIMCKTYQTELYIEDDTYDDFLEKPEFSKMMNLIVEKIIRHKKAPNNACWIFYYNQDEQEPNDNPVYVNLASLLKNYPKTFMERADRVLLNLSVRNPNYGGLIVPDYHEYRLYFPNGQFNEQELKISAEGELKILEDLGYIKHENRVHYIITADGWKHIEESNKKFLEVKQGFIAMSFKQEADTIRKCFKGAIIDAGYFPMVIDEKEHNHQIVPELLKEIEKSRFLVLDVTYPNYGAYYEAGYALALGKEVIICCSNQVFNDTEDKYERPHFDIAQASQIRWDTEEELVERLKKRIKATVPE